ncbi:MAG: hypothetical protein ACKOEC_00290 [Acidimicrobiia bacterium]
MAVMIGGGYATGRELVEFFLIHGPATGLASMAVTGVIIAGTTMIGFELARRFEAFDYQSFCQVCIGPLWVVFEAGYLALLLLVLSVVSSAAGALITELLGTPELLNSVLFMATVAYVVFYGNDFLERVITAWSITFYVSYGSLLIAVLYKFGDALGPALAMQPIDPRAAWWSGVGYAGLNVVLIPILIFVARNFRSRSEALLAGAIAAPLIIVPGFTLLIALSAFYPGINDERIPVSAILGKLDIPILSLLIPLVILGALVKSGAGMLHGLNERIAGAFQRQGKAMGSWVRPTVALFAMTAAVYAASWFGLIDLIKYGYRFSSYFFIVVMFVPLMTRGLWLICRR